MLKKRILPVFLVFAPVILAVVYLAIASETYRSRATFVVRSADSPAQSGLPVLLRAVSPSMGSDAPSLVRDYIASPDVVQSLDKALSLREHYAQGDIFQKFPRPWDRPTMERFVDYFGARSTVALDAQSMALTLTTEAFSAQMAQAINERTLDLVRNRVAELNEQIRRDTLGLAQKELERAHQRLAQAGKNLAEFRIKNRILDPERQAALDLQLGQEMESKLAAARAKLRHAEEVAAQSPAAAALRAEVAALEQFAARAQNRAVAGGKDSKPSLSDEQSRLMLEREIAAKVVAAAEEALIKARSDAERRHLYVEVISAATLPDDSAGPRPVRVILASLMAGLLGWAVVWLLGIGIREHGADRV